MGTNRSTGSVLGLFVLMLGLLGCAPKDPIKIGFLGGVSGRSADLGIGGRNGAILAVEMRNQSGGIAGRKIELVVEDDQQDPVVAKQATARLIANKVEAIIGPMTSAMAIAIVAQANEAKVLMLSPTVTTTALSGRDDYFLRVIASTTAYARNSAAYHFSRQGIRRTVAVYDARNNAYTESWLADYRVAYEALGGEFLAALHFISGPDTRFPELAEELLMTKPDGVVILANSVDAALLVQHLRKRNATIPISTSEWAGTERLLELGGKSVEGLVIAQFLDRDSKQPAYVDFRKAYVARFADEPGFAGLTAFDATRVVLEGLTRKQEGQTLKQAILQQRSFAGAQSTIEFDANGDAKRASYLTTIHDGQFVRLP